MRARATRCHATGQALIEFAIFAIVFLGVLATLIHFALQADYQQQAMIQSFRQSMRHATLAMKDSGTPTAVSSMVTSDRIIPDPTHPFEIGTASQVSYSSLSPTRTYRLGQSADLEELKDASGTVINWRPRIEELNRQLFTFQGGAAECPSAKRLRTTRNYAGQILNPRASGCTTEGFTPRLTIAGFDSGGNNASNYSELDRYNEIYGASAIRPFGITRGGGIRSAYIIDPMEGEIISKVTGERLCRLLFVNEACEKNCLLGKDPKSEIDCKKVCNAPIRRVPWYCSTAKDGSISPALTAIFQDINSLGIQLDQTTVQQNMLRRQKEETAAGIKSTDTITRWHEHTERMVKYHDPATHTVKEYPGPGQPQVFTAQDERSVHEWETPWPAP